MLRQAGLWLGLSVMLAAFALWGTNGLAFAPGKQAPEISGGPWLNSQPLTIHALKGRVVMVQFWTYG